MKVLVIRFSSIGDIVLTSPVVRCLKTQVAGTEIHFLTKSSFVPLLSSNPNIDKIIPFEGDLLRTRKEIQENKYDFIVDLHHNLRSRFITAGLRIPTARVHKINMEKWLMVRFKKNRLPAYHIVDRYLATLSVFHVKNDGAGLDYYFPKSDIVDLDELPASHRNGYIAIAIGAKFATKRLPDHKLISLCQNISFPIVLLGGREDRITGEKIQEAAGNNVYNCCGRYNINQSASLVQQSKLIITHDTGLMHIAAAFNKRIISIWGNTIPEFGMSPYLPNVNAARSTMIEVKNLSCRPCSKIGFDRCPKSHFKCMNEIDEAEIIKALA